MEVFKTIDGLTNNWVSAIVEDVEGNLWFATMDGVSRLSDEIWITYRTSDGLAGDWVKSIDIGQNDSIWFATSAGVSRFDGEFTSFTTADGLLNNDVLVCYVDSKNAVWFGTKKGVSSYDGDWKSFSTDDGLADSTVKSIFEDSKGIFWFGTKKGVTRYDGNWSTLTIDDGLCDNRIKCVFEDSDGTMWYGTANRLSMYNGKWTTFDKSSGLPDNEINCIYEDHNGYLWIGTGGGGVSKYDGSWRIYSTSDGLGDNWVTAIIQDSKGNMWFCTYGEGGITCYTKDEIPPDTIIIEGPKETIGTASALFEFSGGDMDTPTSELLYSMSIDDGPWSPFFSETRKNIPPQQNGRHVLAVRAKDKDGNIDPTPATRSFNVDLIPPTVVINYPSKKNEVVHGNVNIIGSAFDNSEVPDFKNYTLEFGKGSAEDIIDNWQIIAKDITDPVVNGLLGIWKTENLYGDLYFETPCR